jgi:hypothetical protein
MFSLRILHKVTKKLLHIKLISVNYKSTLKVLLTDIENFFVNDKKIFHAQALEGVGENF